MEGETPASLNGSPFSNSVALVVPASAIDTYRSEWSSYASQICSAEYYKKELTLTANDSYSALHKAIGEDNLSSVVDLKVTGSINSYDFMIFNNKMPNLMYLDLSECTIKQNSYEFRTGYHTETDKFPAYGLYGKTRLYSVKLPQVTAVGDYAFYGCTNLKEVTPQEGLISVGNYSFYKCSSLQSIVFQQGLTSIGSSSFSDCSALKTIDLPDGVTSIGSYAFQYCRSLQSFNILNGVTAINVGTFTGASSLTELTIPNSVKNIYSSNYESPFSGTKITSITIPEACTSIPNYCFSGMSYLKEVNLPKTLKSIGSYAFYGQIKKISIPSSVTSVGENAFSNCTSLDTVYVYTVEPTNIAQNTFATATYNNAVLMVPRTSYFIYYYNTQWSQFKNLQEYDAPFEYFYVNDDYALEDDSRVLGSPDIDINPGAGLVITGEDEQLADTVTINANGTNSGSVVADGNLNAKSVTINISVTADKWYYFCFPFDVNMSDIKAPGSHIFHTYNGAVRAQNGSGGWTKVSGVMEQLTKGKGYIFQCNSSGQLQLRVDNPDFSGDDIDLTLSSYISANADDASWNFVGNPFPCYYPVQEMGYTAPLTVWNLNNRTYEAISPLDDEYILQPFQSFFVQKPAEVQSLNFTASKRMTYKQTLNSSAQAASMRTMQATTSATRQVINLFVTDDECTDRTRVVMNGEASMDYEMGCDAAKFISSDAPIQLYTCNNGVNYAINERPMGNAEVNVGYQATQNGNYTLYTTAPNVQLYDKLTGITTRLSQSGYSFSTKAGTCEDRFVLICESNNSTSDIDGIDAATTSATSTYYNAAGIAVGTDASLLPAGTYMLKGNGKCEKVVIM